ncbi:MAG: OB-fold protein [Sphingomonadales bacterium]
MKNKKILFLLLLVVAILGAFYAYREYNRAPIDTAAAAPGVALTGADLIAAFEQDEAGATARYVNKLISVQAVLLDIVTTEAATPDEKESYTLVLGSTEGSTTVRCSMDSSFALQQASLTKGKSITLQGICSGYNKDELLGSDIVLVRCALVNN